MFPTLRTARFSNRDGRAVIRSDVASLAASNGKPTSRSPLPLIGVPPADMSSSMLGLPNDVGCQYENGASPGFTPAYRDVEGA
jgi:hypothetical protein